MCVRHAFRRFQKKGTGLEAIWLSDAGEAGFWRDEVDWTSNQDFCKLCVSTGIADIDHMTSGEETEEELRRLLKICPWLAQLSEGDITKTGLLFKALNLLFKVADNRELHTDWADYMSSLELVKKRMLHLAAVQLMRRC